MLALDGPNFRQAQPSDEERLIEIEGQAYPSEWSHAERRRAIFDNPLGALKELIVAEIRGKIVAQAFLFPLVTWWGGRKVKTGGIASVGVAVEARGQGIASALMAHIHGVAAKRRMLITMLYAFRHGFYRRLGYAATSSRKRLLIDPRSIPWKGSAQPAQRTTVERLHVQAARISSGVHQRPRALWDERLAREQRHWLMVENGYVAFELVQKELHAETICVVDELVALDSAARRQLLGALGGLRDQCSTIELEVAEDDPLEHALIDPDARRFGTEGVEHTLGNVIGGPLVRITDVEAAITARGYAADGSFCVETDTARLGVAVRQGQAHVVKPTRKMPILRANPTGLAAVLYGALSVDRAADLGLIEANPGIDRLLRLPPVVPFDAF
jgi:predicted acetyltransferase